MVCDSAQAIAALSTFRTAMSFLNFLLYVLLGCGLAYLIVRLVMRRLQVRLPGRKLRYLHPYQPSDSEKPCP